MARAFLTTIDNPFNPFVDFDSWYGWDMRHGYYCLSYVARLANTSDELPDEVNDRIVNDAIDAIVELNVTGKYLKIFETPTDATKSKELQKDLDKSETVPPVPGEGSGV